jgi:hypothetical protein
VEDGKKQAIAMCEQAGGDPLDIEIVDLETIPEPYAMDGTFRLVVRVVSSIRDVSALRRRQIIETDDTSDKQDISLIHSDNSLDTKNTIRTGGPELTIPIDAQNYRPNITSGIWNVSETDIEFLIAGTGVLGVGCIGEATNYLLSLKRCLREGKRIQIVSCGSVSVEEVICAPLWMVS